MYPEQGEPQDLVAQPLITRVCGQIRDECLPVFYGGNVFLMNSEHSLPKTNAWIKSIGVGNRRNIEHLYISFDSDVGDVFIWFGTDLSVRRMKPEVWVVNKLTDAGKGGQCIVFREGNALQMSFV